MEKKIIIVSGDPNSINSELIYKCWKKISKSLKHQIILISNFQLLKKQFKKLNYPVSMIQVKNINDVGKTNKLKILNINLNFKKPFEVKDKSASEFIIKSLNTAHRLGLNENVKGIINCAISKKLLKKDRSGVTEYLALKCNVPRNSEVMLITNGVLSVAPITTHIDLRDVAKKIKKELIVHKIKSLDKCFKDLFKRNPKIGLLGLNPHNAEFRKDSEEMKFIIPSVKKLRKNGIKIKGPLISDITFVKDYNNYDVIVGMYHDQVLSPFKSIFKFDAINLTLGLKYLRVSPDHGTATNLIGKRKADPMSLIRCVEFINKFGK